MGWSALRLAAVACVAIAVAVALLARPRPRACRTELGACARNGVARCDTTLGDWRVVRARDAGLPPGSHSACILSREAAGTPVGDDAPVSIVPQDPSVSGDTLLSLRPAARLGEQRATVQLSIHGAEPDHWVFGLAGKFLDRGATPACPGMRIVPPVNAAYAVIGGNWDRRPHGFYFERLAAACVYDGGNDACPGDAPSIPHEFVAGEAFVLDLALTRADADWWLDATVAALDASERSQPRELGRMRLAVGEPCWLEPGEPGRALVVVIPHPDPAHRTADVRVDVARFAWR